MKGRGGGSFLDFYRAYIQAYRNDNQMRLFEKYSNVYNKLADYLSHTKKKDLAYSDLTLKFLQGFEKWLLTDYRPKDKQGVIRKNAKANKRNTVSKTLSFIKTIVRQAVKAGELPYTDNPFLNYELATEKTHKDRLTREEILAFEQMPIKEALKDYHIRNVFLMQYYCAGSRVGDVLALKWENIQGTRLVFKMEKTQARQSLEIPPAARRILALYSGEPQDFIFPFIANSRTYTKTELESQIESSTSYINKRLKILFKRLGINKNISTHVARHSFADQARKSGSSLYNISKSLRHSSTKITEIYLESFDESAVDNVLE